MVRKGKKKQIKSPPAIKTSSFSVPLLFQTPHVLLDFDIFSNHQKS